MTEALAPQSNIDRLQEQYQRNLIERKLRNNTHSRLSAMRDLIALAIDKNSTLSPYSRNLLAEIAGSPVYTLNTLLKGVFEESITAGHPETRPLPLVLMIELARQTREDPEAAPANAFMNGTIGELIAEEKVNPGEFFDSLVEVVSAENKLTISAEDAGYAYRLTAILFNEPISSASTAATSLANLRTSKPILEFAKLCAAMSQPKHKLPA